MPVGNGRCRACGGEGGALSETLKKASYNMDKWEEIAAKRLPCICAGDASHFSICPAYYRLVFAIALRQADAEAYKRGLQQAAGDIRGNPSMEQAGKETGRG